MNITICALFYGNYPELAKRLLQSLSRLRLGETDEVRFGLNNVCPETAEMVQLTAQAVCAAGSNAMIYHGDAPYYKYPTMWKMLWSEPFPVDTDLVMWFDDDSYINDKNPKAWLEDTKRKMVDCEMMGSTWRLGLFGGQRGYIKDQPWYTGKPIPKLGVFITGGWWVIHTKLLAKHNWPTPDLEHNGGDLMFGQLCHQQGYRLKNQFKGVCINADETGKCSSAPRRGFSQARLGTTYERKKK